MSDTHDTQPNMRKVEFQGGVDAPPRILFWGMIGLFVVVIGGAVFGYFALNNILNSGQQQRVVEALPFMDAFIIKQPTPAGGILPTPELDEASNNAALDLLNAPLSDSDEDTGDNEVPSATPTIAPTETPLPSATPTPLPSATPTPIATATPLPTATAIPTEDTSASSSSGGNNTNAVSVPVSARLYGFTHQQQTWNNCGPATITMALSYYGWQNDQSYAASYLKPNREDKNVSPQELVDFVNERTAVRALWRMGGSLDLIKTLLSNDFPVVIESGLMPEAYDWIGHYRALVAYDDSIETIYMYDSFLGKGDFDEGIQESYADVDEMWRHFNRIFIVIYEPDREAQLMTLLGDLATEEGAAEVAFNTAQAEARSNPQDGHAWFNMGTSLVELERYEEAANAFDQARRYGLPFRMTWYQFGPFIAYYETERYDDVQALAQNNLNNAEELEETYYWQGRVLLAQGNPNQAAVQFRQALRYNPNFEAARQALDGIS
jgi:tetratricopeptide (TPR) repeat protein